MKFPDNYTLWVHKKGVKTDQYNARTDAYLFGAPHLGPRTARSSQASPTVFRSPMEFVPHAIWLMRGCTGQCDCKYCIPGQNQKDINRRLNHGVDADSDDDDVNNGGSGTFQNAAATADRFANIILPQLRVVEALTPVRVASDVIGRLRSISVPREIIGSGLQILVHRLRSMSTRLGTIRTGPQILVRELFLTKGAICWALGSSQLLLSVFFWLWLIIVCVSLFSTPNGTVSCAAASAFNTQYSTACTHVSSKYQTNLPQLSHISNNPGSIPVFLMVTLSSLSCYRCSTTSLPAHCRVQPLKVYCT